MTIMIATLFLTVALISSIIAATAATATATTIKFESENDCPKVDIFDEKNCLAFPCQHDGQCSQGAACCNNGCVHTCVDTHPPQEFDWVEETPDRPELQSLEGISEDAVFYLDCKMTRKQYKRLMEMKDSDHLKDCFCRQGNVYCHVVK